MGFRGPKRFQRVPGGFRSILGDLWRLHWVSRTLQGFTILGVLRGVTEIPRELQESSMGCKRCFRWSQGHFRVSQNIYGGTWRSQEQFRGYLEVSEAFLGTSKGLTVSLELSGGSRKSLTRFRKSQECLRGSQGVSW